MRILISNDDGVHAPGLKHLARALSTLSEVTVVAPDRDRSAASNSLTIDRPLRAIAMDNGFVAVNGTPTDCVHLAVGGWMKFPPDLVVSGINSGANLGDDVIYSGTVAAAMEGRFLGYPAIAVSLASGKEECVHFETAARVIASLVKLVQTSPLPAETILNVNVPDVPYEDIQGVKVTRLGNRHRAEPILRLPDPRGKMVFWVGPPGEGVDAGPETDFHAIKLNYVSVTPLQTDLTHYEALKVAGTWCKKLQS